MPGLLLPGACNDEITAASVIELAVAAERAGFDSVWVGDHLQWSVPFLDPIALLAGVSARTQTIQIGTSVLLAPLRHPVPLAKSLLTIDHMSGGRLIVGLGSGVERGGDYTAVAADPRRRGEAMDASVAALRRLLSDEPAQLTGYWEGEAHLDPAPVRGSIPLYLGGHSRAALRRTARAADGWIASFIDPSRLAARIDGLRRDAETAGRSAEDIRVVVIVYVSVADSVEEATAAAEPYFDAMYGMPARRAVDMSAFGTLDSCTKRVQEFLDAGADDVIVAHTGLSTVALDALAAVSGTVSA